MIGRSGEDPYTAVSAGFSAAYGASVQFLLIVVLPFQKHPMAIGAYPANPVSDFPENTFARSITQDRRRTKQGGFVMNSTEKQFDEIAVVSGQSDKKALLNCMDTIPQGVFIVGSIMGDTVNLMTAAFATQVSFNPPSVAVSVANSHYTAELVEKGKKFTLSVLANGQKKEAAVCGFRSGRDTEKAKRVRYEITESGLPVISDAAAWMECHVRQSVIYEDHTLFLAEIRQGERKVATPMIYHTEDFFR